MLNQVLTQNIPNSSNTDGTTPYTLGGKAGEFIVAELHGKWYTAAYRGRTYIGSTASGGTTLATITTTTATFALFNGSSSVVVEPIGYDLGMIGTTSVVGTVFAGFSNQVPSTTTAITATVMGLNVTNSAGPGNQQASLYSAATITAQTVFLPLFNITSTADLAVGNLHYEFDGKVVLPHNGLMNTNSNPAQSQTMFQSYQWAEWPV